MDKFLFLKDLKSIPSCDTLEEFSDHFQKLEIKLAKVLCFRLLAQRGMLSSELEKKLTSKGISSTTAKRAVQDCSERGFIDDQQHLKHLVRREQRRGLGKGMIASKLRFTKRVDPELLQEALEAIEPEGDILKQLVQKYAKKIDMSDSKAKQKLIAKLMRRGFSY
ncbi:MAG: regulatory protein RecX, partial [Chlamydiota bacterium]